MTALKSFTSSRPRGGTSATIVYVVLVLGVTVIILSQIFLLPFLITLPYSTEDKDNYRYNGQDIQYTTQYNKQKRPRQRQRIRKSASEADGTFNDVPLTLQSGLLESTIHCVGENYQADAWLQRSCHYTNVCFNASSKEFVMFQSKKEQFLSKFLTQREFMHVSTVMRRRQWNASYPNLRPENTVAIGGINAKWGHDIALLEWAPKILNATQATYYQLPPDLVLIPFHSLNGANPGHLVWDDFLPIYTILRMFQLSDHDILPLRLVLEKRLWASCDWREENVANCKHMINKFLPLLVGSDYPYKFTTQKEARLDGTKSDLVCAKNVVAGLGPLTDHGVTKAHGWEERDYFSTQNHGRGAMIYEFRQFMVNNIGLPNGIVPQRRPHKIVVSQYSSDIPNRNKDFSKQMSWIKATFKDKVHVEPVIFKDMSLHDQIKMVHDAAIFISLCGGGAVNGMFLPKGATAILYFDENGGVKNNRRTYLPARLDWDIYNAMSYLHVHWMPRDTMDELWDERSLLLIIQHELDLIEAGDISR